MTHVSISFDPTDEESVAEAAGALAHFIGASSTEEAEPAPKKESAAAKKKRLAAEAADAEDGDGDEAPDGPTRDDVRDKLKTYAAIEGKDAAIKILEDNGSASIGELDEASFQAVIDACGD